MASATSLPVLNNKILANSSALDQVLQSDSVRRLFNQPNIVIHAIPRNDSPTAYRMVSPNRMVNPKSSHDKNNIVNGEHQLSNKPAVSSIHVIKSKNEETNKEENLLPSKSNGKSEILFVPIIRKRKECGHFEPCESLVCNVIVKQYEDAEGITPLIAINITEDEIDALVKKHCENDKCDAISIDHNRCRRASIQLNLCDKCIKCDICGITFQSRKAHLNHKKCRRKNVYQHNNATASELFKFRMRERELQLIESARLKRTNDYLDPVLGFKRTMQALTNNDELIITPRRPPVQSKTSKTHIPIHKNNFSSSKNNNNSNNSIKIVGRRKLQALNNNRELTSEMISNIILSCQNSINMNNKNEKNDSLSSKQIKSPAHLNGATVNIRQTTNIQNQSHLNPTGLPSSNLNISVANQQQKLLIGAEPPSNINLNLQQIINSTGLPTNNINAESLQQINGNWVPNEPCATTYKVVPIAELKSEPSLLHKTQGVPKFCVVSDTTAIPQLIPKIKLAYKKKKLGQNEKKQLLVSSLPKTQVLSSGKFRPLLPVMSGNVRNVDVKLGSVLLKKHKGRKRRKKIRKGKFKCTHCPKRFSTIDYCKLHIAKHENNPGFFCRLCEKAFLNKYIMRKHMDAEHKPGEVRCEMCYCVLPSMQELVKHMKNPETKVELSCSECQKSFGSCSSLDFHMRSEHGFLICTLCKRQVTKSKMKKHITLEHSISKNRTDTGFKKLCYAPQKHDKVCEIDLISEITFKTEPIVKPEPVSEKKVEADCIARSRSARRRSSKEFFVCTVCQRRFENEKQFQIHLANNPMKFTPCPSCGRKFHRKSEYTEHSKTCSPDTVSAVIPPTRKRKLNLSKEQIVLKYDNDIAENSIDQKQKDCLDSNKCKKVKLDQEEFVQKEDKEDKSIVKSTVKIKIVNGLKQDSSDCLEMLKIIHKEENKNCAVTKDDDEEVLLLNTKQTQINSNESTVFDTSRIVISINQDHNYQALQ